MSDPVSPGTFVLFDLLQNPINQTRLNSPFCDLRPCPDGYIVMFRIEVAFDRMAYEKHVLITTILFEAFNVLV